MRTLVAIVAIVVSLAACTALPTRGLRPSSDERAAAALHPLPPPSTTGFAPANATPEQRAATLEHVWQAIADLFYDPKYNGVDLAALRVRSAKELETVASDADFYRVLKRNVRALHDSHTGIEDPREAQNIRTNRATQIGLAFTWLEGSVVVVRVVPDFPADQAGVRPGMIVDRIDDETLDEAFFERAKKATPDAAEPPVVTPATTPEPTAVDAAALERAKRLVAVVRLLAAAPNGDVKPHRVVFRNADETLLTTTLEARAGEVPAREGYVLLPSGIGVLRLTRFDSVVLARLGADIDRARLETRGLILDLRGNGGGEVRMFQWLVGRFLPRREVLVETLKRDGGNRPLEAPAAAKPYLKPLAILTDRGTASAAELTSHALAELRDAVIVGEPTCGCVVGVSSDSLLPDGGALRVAQIGFRSAHGRRMEGDPLVPTIPVTPTLTQWRLGDDVAIRAAEQALSSR